MASLLMPTRKACGRYVCHDVCLSAPTVRTLNSTRSRSHSVIFEMPFINAPRVTTRSSQAMSYKSRMLSRACSFSRISVPELRQARMITTDDRSFRVFRVITITARHFNETSLVERSIFSLSISYEARSTSRVSRWRN